MNQLGGDGFCLIHEHRGAPLLMAAGVRPAAGRCGRNVYGEARLGCDSRRAAASPPSRFPGANRRWILRWRPPMLWAQAPLTEMYVLRHPPLPRRLCDLQGQAAFAASAGLRETSDFAYDFFLVDGSRRHPPGRPNCTAGARATIEQLALRALRISYRGDFAADEPTISIASAAR